MIDKLRTLQLLRIYMYITYYNCIRHKIILVGISNENVL